jgi:hypothetical protein
MAEKRSSRRVETTIQLNGKLYNVVDFKVRNISIGGINIICNFQPQVGSQYTIFLMDNGVTQDFDVQVLRCEVEGKVKPGEPPKLSIGARFVNLDSERRRFLDCFLKKQGEHEGGLLTGRDVGRGAKKGG